MPDRRFDMLPAAPWRSGPRPTAADAYALSIEAALTEAVGRAREGDFNGARQLCAAVVLDAQPLIAARTTLFRVALHALLLAQGFKLLARLVMAVTGRSIQVSVLPEAPLGVTGPIAPPHVRPPPRHTTPRTTYALDPRWLAQLTPDDMFLRQWCDALIAGEPPQPVPAKPEPAARHLETV